jgi:hypothetical protein
MPIYHFNVGGDISDPDAEGVELEDLTEAKCEAVKLAGRIICDEAAKFWDYAEWSLTVTDAAGLSLCTIQIIGTEAPAIRVQAVLPPASA